MRLEIGSIAVEEVALGARTTLDGHTLLVDAAAVRALVLEDPHFADVQVQVVLPGEDARVIHAVDVVEPRWKVAGPGGVFPGFVAPPRTVGAGRTHRLAGVAVVEAHAPVPGEQTHFREQVIDMRGPGAEHGAFGQTANVVLCFEPNLEFFPPGSERAEDVLGGSEAAQAYSRAVTQAGMKVAALLGQTAAAATPDEQETFDLTRPAGDLLPVVCAYHLQFPYLYGLELALPAGTLLCATEFLDGAVGGWRQCYQTTYWNQNNPALLALARRHGRDLDFRACILFGDESAYRADKERVADVPVRLAKLLGAQAALFLGVNGSNYAVDTMWALQECERAGIATALLYFDVGTGRDDPGFIYAVPEADAIVNTGSRDQPIALPPAGRVIGGDQLLDGADAAGAITIPMRWLHASLGVQGYSQHTTRFH